MNRELVLFIALVTLACVDHAPMVIVRVGLPYSVLHYCLWVMALCIGASNALKAQRIKYWLRGIHGKG